MNGEIRDQEKTMRDLKIKRDSDLNRDATDSHHHPPHDGLKGDIPADKRGIEIKAKKNGKL